MRRVQLCDAARPEERHGALDLIGQERDRPVHALAPAGHQTVQIRPSHEREPRAERERRDNVGAVHDAGVEVNLHVPPKLTNNFGQQVERNRRTVKLPPTMIGEQDRIDAQPGNTLGVLERLDALHHQFTLPLMLDPSQVLIVNARIEARVDEVRDRARPAVERGEREWLRDEEIEPPGGTSNRIQNRPGVSAGGTVMPFRLSRRRAPATGTSPVTRSASNPARAARSMSAIDRSRSFHV